MKGDIMNPALVQLIATLVLGIIEQGPEIIKSVGDMIDNSEMTSFDKAELKMRLKKAQDNWKIWE